MTGARCAVLFAAATRPRKGKIAKSGLEARSPAALD